MKSGIIITGVEHDAKTGLFAFRTSIDGRHLVSTELLRAAGIDSPHNVVGEPYPFKNDDEGNAVAFVPMHERDAELDPVTAKVGVDEQIKQPSDFGEAAKEAGIIITAVALDESVDGWRVETNDGKGHVVTNHLLQTVPQNIAEGVKVGWPYLFVDNADGYAVEVAGREAPKGKPEPVTFEAGGFRMVEVKGRNVTALGHKGDELRVHYKGKPGEPDKPYLFKGISEDVFTQLLTADSIGKFLKAEIEGTLGIKGTAIVPATPPAS